MLLAHPRRCGGQETMAAVERQRRRSKTTAAVKRQRRRSSKPSSRVGASTMNGGGSSSRVAISQCCLLEVDEWCSSKISLPANGSCKHHDRRDRRSCLLTAAFCF